jgi:dihydroorotase
MKSKFLIKNAQIINEGKIFPGSVLVEGEFIKKVFGKKEELPADVKVIDAGGNYLIPGVIDDHVHFRDPGLTYKADIHSESRAAVAGGVTSYMDMPNTIPQTTTIALLEEKLELASEKSLANYAFYLGATNNNLKEIINIDPRITCGIKLFMGASTGNMLVNEKNMKKIFKETPLLVAVHAEHEGVIQMNAEYYRNFYNGDVPMYVHPLIRSEFACFLATMKAVALAVETATRLHILHTSTHKETNLFFDEPWPTPNGKLITSEVCVHHLWFCDDDYDKYGTLIKWNPAIKTKADRAGLLQALKDGKIDVIGTDHAPHTLEEKQNNYFKAPSGGPSVQHSLPLMFELANRGDITKELVVEKMCHNVARCFGVEKRGFIRKGYYADLVIINANDPWTVDKSNILYKCGWSPYEGTRLQSHVTHTFVNGHLVYQNGAFDESIHGQALQISPFDFS